MSSINEQHVQTDDYIDCYYSGRTVRQPGVSDGKLRASLPPPPPPPSSTSSRISSPRRQPPSNPNQLAISTEQLSISRGSAQSEPLAGGRTIPTALETLAAVASLSEPLGVTRAYARPTTASLIDPRPRDTPADRFLSSDLKPCVGELEGIRKTRNLIANVPRKYRSTVDYVDICNSWLMAVNYRMEETSAQRYSLDGGRTYQYRVSRTVSLPRTSSLRPVYLDIRCTSTASTKREALSRCTAKLISELSRLTATRPQGDEGEPITKETIQGSVSQDSTKDGNTVITRDADEEVTTAESTSALQEFASSEPVYNFPQLTNRWMPLANFSVSTSDTRGKAVFVARFPEYLFSQAKCAPNLAPFEAFVYMNYSIELKVVLNANKFQTGKLIATHTPDAYGAEAVSDGLSGALTRPHAVMDLPSRNEAMIKIPFKFRAPFVRVVNTAETTTAVKAGESCRFVIYVLSPMRVATDGLTTAFGQIFYRLSKTNFAGMSYRVAFQSDGKTPSSSMADDAVRAVLPLRTVSIISGNLERMADQLGSSHNQDKPNDPTATVVVPKPRSNFPNVRGIDDATALRSFSTGMTNYHKVHSPSDEPKSPLDLARIWGLLQTNTWGVGDKPGARLFDVKIDPTGREQAGIAAPTPLEVSCGFFNYWGGPIEVRFDFVSTSFHQGTVMISMEFGRPVSDADVCSTGSTYTKTFHLGEQKSTTITVPYIFDTPLRRTSGANLRLLATHGDYPANGTDQRSTLNLTLDVHAFVRMTVINELRPIQSVSSTIDVLMFWRAGENFTLMGLKQCDFSDSLCINSNNYIHNLPNDFFPALTTSPVHDAPPIHAVRVQMDRGEKEDQDKTKDFSPGVPFNHAQISDDVLDFKDILRRPTMLYDRVVVNAHGSPTGTNTNLGFFIPVTPPSRDWTNLTKGATSPIVDQGSIATSPSTAIMNMFRGWRGSTKYTFLFVPDDKVEVIYITYLPHTGVTKMGNINFPTTATDTTLAFTYPYKCGYATEIVVPSINPTATIVVPYESELNWTLTFETSGSSNYTWRDKGYLNAGHVLIQCIGGNAKMTAWWAAGDDFALNLFYGPSFVYNESNRWTMSELGTVVSGTPTTSSEFTEWQSRNGLNLADTTTPASASAATRVRRDTTTQSATTTAAGTTTAQAAPDPVRHHHHANFRDVIRHSSKPELATRYVYPAQGYSVSAYRNELWKSNSNKMSSADFSFIMDLYQDWYRRAPAVQSDSEDFRFSDALASAKSVLKSITPRMALTGAIAAIPLVGPAVATGMSAGAVVDRIEDVSHRMSYSSTSFSRTMDTVTAKIEHLSQKADTSLASVQTMLQQLTDSIVGTMPNLYNMATYVYNFLLDMFIAWYHQSWLVVGVSVVRLVGQAFPTAVIARIAHYGAALGEAISRFVASNNQVNAQADSSVVETLVGVLLALVGTVVGVSLDTSDLGFATRLFRRVTTSSGMSYFVQTMRFVGSLFTTIKELFMRALGHVSPEAAALKALAGKDAELGSFIRDAQQVTSEVNNSLLSIPAYRTRVWKTVMQACQIQRLLAEVPANKASPTLSRLCHDVIKFGNERFVDIASCPVRYEPFVICIEGDTNIGKSYMTEELLTALLESVGYNAPASNVAFIRQPGNPFWTGLRDQPAVVFDDWLQMNDNATVATQLSELFQLKTPAIFSPNMAHLEEKKIRANPLIVVLLCNDAFPNISLANCPSAVFRRRDAVFKVVKRSAYTDTPVADIPDEVSRNFGHLKFFKYASSEKSDSLINRSVSYEDFLASLKDKFGVYHGNEKRNVRRRLDRLFRLNRIVPAHLIDIGDPFQVYYNSQMAGEFMEHDDDLWITSERLERDVQAVYTHMMERAAAMSEEQLERAINAPVPPPAPDVPVDPAIPQPQFDYLHTMYTAAVTSIPLWTWVFKHLASAANTLSSAIAGSVPTNSRRFECSVCYTEQPIDWICASDYEQYTRTGEMRHPVCNDCWRGVERVGPVRCPVCRHEARPMLLVSEEEMTFFGKVIVAVGRGVMKLADAFNYARVSFESVADVQRWLEILHLIVMFLQFASSGDAPSGEDVTFAVVRTAARVVFQADDGDDGEEAAGGAPPSGPNTPAPNTEGGLGLDDVEIADLLGGLSTGEPSTSGTQRRRRRPPPEREARRAEIRTSISMIRDSITQWRASHRLPINPTRAAQDLSSEPASSTDAEEAAPDPGDAFYDVEEERPPFHPLSGTLPQTSIMVHDLVARGVRATVREFPYCYHHSLENAWNRPLYRNNQWETYYDGTRVYASDYPCNPDCLWAGPAGYEVQKAFYERFLNENQQILRTYVHNSISAQTQAMRDLNIHRIPIVMRPEWMVNTAIGTEVANLTVLSWWDSLTGIFTDYAWLLRVMAGVVMACGTITAGYALYGHFVHPAVPSPVAQTPTHAPVGSLAATVSIQSPWDRTEQAQQRRYIERPRYNQRRQQSDGVLYECPSISEVVEKYILRNSVTAELREGGVVRMIYHGLGLCGHTVLIPRHYRSHLLSGKYDIFIGPVEFPHRRQAYTPSPQDFKEFVSNDILVWEWPASTPSFKDIRKFFVQEKDLETPVPSRVTLYVLPGRKATNIRAVEVELSGAEGAVPVRGVDDEMFEIQDVWVYNYSQPGACGSPLVRPDHTRPIIGIHVAGCGEGFDGQGYSLILTQEQMKDLSPSRLDPPTVPGVVQSQAATYFDDSVQVNYHGVLPPSMRPYLPQKTKLERSEIFGAEGLTVDVRPSVMSPHDPAYIHPLPPLVYGAAKYGKISRDFTTEQLQGPRQFLTDMLDTMKPSVVPCSKLTVSEGIVGLPNIDFFDPMDLNTSAGYPLMLQGGVTKGDFFDVEFDEIGTPIRASMRPALKQLYDKAEEVRMAGERYPTIWVDTLKDEKRPTAKAISAGGTRLICNGPLEHALAMRRSFLHFSAAFMKNRHKLMHAVGINPTSYEWHAMAVKLLAKVDKKSRQLVTLDYSNFGPAFNGRVCFEVVQLIIAWTIKHVQGVNRNEMVSLMEEVQNSYHLCRDIVISQNCGAPSGNQMTTVINSLVNMFYILTAWEALVGSTCLRSGLLIFEEFRQCVHLVVYGDDLIMAVNTYFDEFNASTITAFFAKYNIVATDSEKKQGVVTKGVSFLDAAFLKRKFHFNNKRNCWMSKLNEDSLRASTQWVWRSANRGLSTRINCSVAVLGAHGHGPDFFNDFRDKVNAALRRKHLEPISTTWSEIDTLFYDTGYATTT